MKNALLSLLILFTTTALAESETMKFTYKSADIYQIIQDYSAASGQKFIIEPSVRGVITITNPGPVSLEEAFDQLSTALAANGLGISKRDNVMVVMQARAVQRNLIEVSKELPALKPERMATWIITLKHADADELNKQIRILTSKDGELVPYSDTNQIVVSDWTSNLHRIAQIIQNIDIPTDPKRKALVAAKRKERQAAWERSRKDGEGPRFRPGNVSEPPPPPNPPPAPKAPPAPKPPGQTN